MTGEFTSHERPLKGRTVAIIGGSGGIGYAAAEHAVRAGANVAIAARDPGRLADASERLSALAGRPVGHQSLSIENRHAVADWIASNSPVDHLVMPGSTVLPTTYDELTEQSAQAAFASKFWGPFWAIHDGRDHLAPDGSVVLFSGVAAQRPVRGYIVGACINGALEAACRSLALELAPRRVNVIAPGFIFTPLFENLHTPEDLEQRLDDAQRRLPIGRPGTPDEAALAVMYLITNGFVTGQVLTVDGGLVVTE